MRSRASAAMAVVAGALLAAAFTVPASVGASTVGADPPPGGTDATGPVPDPDAVLGGTDVPSDPVAVVSGVVTTVTDEIEGEGEGDDGQEPADPDGGSQPPPETGPAPDPAPGPDERPASQDSEPEAAAPEPAPEDGASPEQAPLERQLEVLRELDGAAVYGPPLVSPPAPPIDYVDVRRGPRSTREIVDMLEAAGATTADIVEVLAPFPVAGRAAYGNDWGAPRHSPTSHAHQGTDLFAPRGTPVVSSLHGVVDAIAWDTPIGGNSVRVRAADGTYLYYAHLDGFAEGLRTGMTVEVGTVLGSVGDTGNAAGTPPHLHFEVHPGGAEAIPPLPYLDQWLLLAQERAAVFVGTPRFAVPPAPRLAPALGVVPAVTEPYSLLQATPSGSSRLRAGLVWATLALAFLVRRRWWRAASRRFRPPADVPAEQRVLARDVLAPYLPPPPSEPRASSRGRETVAVG